MGRTVGCGLGPACPTNGSGPSRTVDVLTTVEGGVVRLRTRPSLWNAMRPPSDEQSATAILRGLRPNTSLRKACSLFRPRGVVRDSGWRSLSGVETLAWRSLPRVPANANCTKLRCDLSTIRILQNGEKHAEKCLTLC